MNIDELTIGQVKQLQALIAGAQAPSAPHPFLGRYVIARCEGAGVHAGVLVSGGAGNSVILRDSRRLWRWKTKQGLALSGLSVHGIDASESKLDERVDEIALTGVLELIPCTDAAKESINAA